jgi:hypothetical protein
MNVNRKVKIPIIMYEESRGGEKTNVIPYIEIGKDEEMPKVLFISEYKETGEFEADAEYGSAPIIDMLIHKYVDIDFLKLKVDAKTFDKIRISLGMAPLKQAQKDGQKILDKVFSKAQENKKDLAENTDTRTERAFNLGESLRKKAEGFLKDNKTEQDKS